MSLKTKIKENKTALIYAGCTIAMMGGASLITYALTKNYDINKHRSIVQDLHIIARDAGVLDTLLEYQDANGIAPKV